MRMGNWICLCICHVIWTPPSPQLDLQRQREHQRMETARHHICIYHVILMGLGQELNLHLPLQCSSEFPTSEIKLVCHHMCLEARKPTQNPEIPKNHCVYTNFVEKFARTFAFFPATRVRKPTKIVQIKLLRWTLFFGVDFFRGEFSSHEC